MIIAVDFDGTLAVTDYPTIIKPIKYVIKFCKMVKHNGHTLILWTCRHGKELDEAVEWCKEQGLTFDYINENPPDKIAIYGDCRKVYADLYIDDHARSLCDVKRVTEIYVKNSKH
jgi:hypothetical protein